ncbi:MAG: glycosyltransferase family 2 protein [Leptolyngbyaceae cyanobacterium]
MLKVSVVIRCYNEARHIDRLLRGIMQQNCRRVEIILVDSGSTDGTVEIARQYPIRLLSIKPENFSFGRALNLGCQAATGDFIVIASAHVYPIYQDWLINLLEPFKDPKTALSYGKQRGNSLTQYSERQIFETWYPDSPGGVQHQDYPFCNNANAAIRRHLWQKIPYDEMLTGLEDLAWAKCLISLGYQIAYVPEAEVIHVHEESLLKIYNRYRREAVALKHIFPQEKFTLYDFIRLFTSNVVNDCYLALKDRVLFQEFAAITMFRLMQFWGTYRGYLLRAPVSKKLRKIFYYPRKPSNNRDLSPPPQRQTIDYKCQSSMVSK